MKQCIISDNTLSSSLKLSPDVRVNVFWFMALAFSLLAALLAILVQQWVRNYMHGFQRSFEEFSTLTILV